MTAFLGSFLEYLIKLAIFVVVAILGAMTGKKLRENKDAKTATVRINNTGKK